MTKEEKCQLAIEKGFTYNQETGKIFGIRGNEIIAKLLGYINLQFYYEGKQYRLYGHQFSWYYINKECVDNLDHINGIRNDNRIINLRSVTHQENQWNRIKAKGYYWHKLTNKWKSQINVNNKKINLGLFEKEEDARAAYLEAKQKYHKIKE